MVGRTPSLGGPGPSPLETWPTAPPGSRHSPVDSCKPATITPNPLTLRGVGWFLKAELYSLMRGGVPVFAPAFQVLGRAPSHWRPGQQAPQPCPGSLAASRIPKMPRCSSAHEKPGLLHRLISCAQSLQPSLTFLLRRNNKVQGAHS